MSTAPAGTPPPAVRNSVDKAAEGTRRVSPVMFAVIGLAFLLPFVTVKCSGQDLVSMKGLDLVTGAEPDINEEFEESFNDFGEGFEVDGEETQVETEQFVESDENDPNIWAIIALGSAIAGLVVSLVLRLRARTLGATITAGLVFLALIILRFDLSGDLDEAQGIVTIDYRFGYWIALLLALVLLLAHGMELLRKPTTATPTASAPPAETPPPAASG